MTWKCYILRRHSNSRFYVLYKYFFFYFVVSRLVNKRVMSSRFDEIRVCLCKLHRNMYTIFRNQMWMAQLRRKKRKRRKARKESSKNHYCAQTFSDFKACAVMDIFILCLWLCGQHTCMIYYIANDSSIVPTYLLSVVI